MNIPAPQNTELNHVLELLRYLVIREHDGTYGNKTVLTFALTYRYTTLYYSRITSTDSTDVMGNRERGKTHHSSILIPISDEFAYEFGIVPD